jgi:hypothetical protein
MKPLKTILKPFSGTIDELLNHVSDFDPNEVEQLVDGKIDVPLSDEEATALIMEELKVNRNDAAKILVEMKEEVVTETITKLMNENIVEVASYDENGQPLYTLTKLGEEYAQRIKVKKI